MSQCVKNMAVSSSGQLFNPSLVIEGIKSDINILTDVWECVNTDYKFLKMCKTMFNFVSATEFVLGYNLVSKKKESFQYVSVTETLKAYLEHDDVLNAVLSHQHDKSDLLTGFEDGAACKNSDYWQSHPLCLLLHLYTDEVEICNPLGSSKKKHKITVVYMTLGNVPRKYLSALRNIHLVLLCPSSVVRKYGLVQVLQPLVNDLQTIEKNGFLVSFAGLSYHFFGTMATLSADNLASHELGGFRMCLSSGRICRHCMVTYNNMKCFYSETDENFPVLRTATIHKQHVASVTGDSNLVPVYGVRGPSCFDNLKTFDVTTHLPPDCMHDVLEGVITKTLGVVLKSLFSRKVLKQKDFDNRLLAFKFGKTDCGDKPPVLGCKFATNDIRGSAAQNYTLLRLLPFLIGNLIQSDDEAWELYM
jgi:hypothetical protein